MSGKKVIKFRWFWDDADHAIETWLHEMALQGLHLKRIRCIRTVFIFEGKGRKDRMIPIGERAVLWVRKYLAEARPYELPAVERLATVFEGW